MPCPSVSRALSGHYRTVNSAEMGYPARGLGVYDAHTMRLFSPPPIALFGCAAALVASLGPSSAQSPSPSPSPVPARKLVLTHAVGSEAVTLDGDTQPNQQLEAALYARFSRDLPTVLLSRQSFASDASGHYAKTMPIASAFFRNAVITAVVRIVSTGALVQASLLVTAPNVPAPPDDIPASVR